MPELRKDPVIGRWVIISTERSKRPGDLAPEMQDAESAGPVSCPFCAGNEHMTPPEILAYREPDSRPNGPGWLTRVTANKFPALKIEGDLDRQGIGMFDRMNGVGAHEVIIESPHHDRRTEDLDHEQVVRVLTAYRERIEDLEKDPRLRYVLVFKNQGKAAGASLTHPHSQIIATPIIPKDVKEKLDGAKSFYDFKERCIYCDVVRQEESMKERVVVDSEHFLAFCPFAPRFPFEVWVIPKRHSCAYTDIANEELDDLASVMKEALSRISKSLNRPPYNYLLHTAPNRIPRKGHWHTLGNDFHWHIEIMPRLTRVAGFEWGSGFYINPTPPEEAAKYLREVVL
ncbi:MAG: galactose-1-phosphate uridylyltransferase [Nitrospirae bacterium]|nr:galactose-1-phosphate uridylyltransferase [Nitrospirota bacterium]